MTTNDRPTVTDEMLEAFRAANPLGGYREALQSVLDLIADTAPSPDPRTDLAGYLGLTEDQAEDCRRSAPGHVVSVYTKVGARLIEQDQARADEPDDGLHAMLDEIRRRFGINVARLITEGTEL